MNTSKRQCKVDINYNTVEHIYESGTKRKWTGTITLDKNQSNRQIRKTSKMHGFDVQLSEDMDITETSLVATSLVAKANSGTTFAERFIENTETLLQLLLANFSSQLTRYQRYDLCDIMKLVERYHSQKLMKVGYNY